MGKFCVNCGSQLEADANFCTSCGTPVESSEAPAPPPRQKRVVMPPVRNSAQTVDVQASMQPLVQQTMQRPMQPPMQQPWPSMQPAPPQPPIQGQRSVYNVPGVGGGIHINDKGLKDMFLRYDNRLNRKPYILRSLALFLVVFVIAFIVTLIGGLRYGSFLASGVSIIGLVPSVLLTIRRLHDLDRPAWWVVGAFIPVINLALSVYILFFPGTPGPNQYGPDPLGGQYQ